MINFSHLILNLMTRLIREKMENNWILEIWQVSEKLQKILCLISVIEIWV